MAVGAADASLDGLEFCEPEAPHARDGDHVALEQTVGDLDRAVRLDAWLHLGAQPALAVLDEYEGPLGVPEQRIDRNQDAIGLGLGLGLAQADELGRIWGQQQALPFLELGGLGRRNGTLYLT